MNFIYQNEQSLCPELCKQIIDMYEIEENRYDGLTLGGVEKTIKDTTDFIIPKQNEKWCKIEKILYEELHKNVLIYLKQHNSKNYTEEFNHGHDSSLLSHSHLEANYFMIQKYDKNKGKYIYHDDFHCVENKYRAITFLWYLNDIHEGGETEFWDNYKIKPTCGKLILFPSFWTYPHRGLMPISDNKYIITNWLYTNL